MSDGTKNHWDRFWASKTDLEEVYRSSPRVLEYLSRHLTEVPSRILEIGAGTGRDSAALASLGHNVVAVDSAPESLELMARSHQLLLSKGVVGADALHLPFADGIFDAVFHQGVLEHFGNPLAFLTENHRVIAPGGIIVVDVPQTYHPWTLIKRAAMRADRWFAGWETDFTPPELEGIVRRAGFEILESYGDWMVPSLAYRLVREGAKTLDLGLPLYPKGPERLRQWRHLGREWLLAHRASLFMAQTIGVVARRPG